MVGKNYIEFMKRLRYSYFIYVADGEIGDKRVNNLSIMAEYGYAIYLCKIKRKDFEWFDHTMEECYEKLKENKGYIRYCRELLSMVSYEGGV